MSERDEGGRIGRQPAEGVRIIRAEEAQAALDAGEAAGRRPDDQLRFGDVPPVPAGPRPAHRFPLPDSVDPSEAVNLPPLASPPQAGETPAWTPLAPPQPPPRAQPGPPQAETGRPRIQAGSAGDAIGPSAAHPGDPVPPGSWAADSGARPPDDGWDLGDRTTEMDAPAAPPSEEGITVSGASPELPHWADPPTGEVPRLRLEDEETEAGEDDMEAWKALGNRGVRWRHEDDWDDNQEIADLVGDVAPVGALDSSRAEHSDLYSFDEDFERVTNRTGSNPNLEAPEDETDSEAEPDMAAAAAGTRQDARQGRARSGRPARPPRRPADADRPAHRPSGRTGPVVAAGSDVGSRVGVGAVLIALLIICYAIGSKALVALAGVIIVAAAAEAYGMLRGAGFRPATLLGLIATGGVVAAAYYKGTQGIAVVTVLLFAGAMMWYVFGVVEARPLANVAVTVMVFVWVGVLGAFAPVMLALKHGQGLFLGAILVAVAADVCAFGVGRWIGSRPIAANISPNKTIEGFLGGLVGALVVGAIVGKELTPWAGMKHGLVLGLVVGIVAPIGDLFESMMKRDLGVKDSGQILAGHGGLLDRFDSILLALPAAYFVATFFKL